MGFKPETINRQIELNLHGSQLKSCDIDKTHPFIKFIKHRLDIGFEPIFNVQIINNNQYQFK